MRFCISGFARLTHREQLSSDRIIEIDSPWIFCANNNTLCPWKVIIVKVSPSDSQKRYTCNIEPDRGSFFYYKTKDWGNFMLSEMAVRRPSTNKKTTLQN